MITTDQNVTLNQIFKFPKHIHILETKTFHVHSCCRLIILGLLNQQSRHYAEQAEDGGDEEREAVGVLYGASGEEGLEHNPDQ